MTSQFLHASKISWVHLRGCGSIVMMPLEVALDSYSILEVFRALWFLVNFCVYFFHTFQT
ncbi:unnamed protein product [Brugia timori]|uniref:Ovule protein n=1 Tax=Brugia timori TaxID=42155 RepID=A0A0R3QY92_9BILA|nr:unnamed protein product [Brugia timori]